MHEYSQKRIWAKCLFLLDLQRKNRNNRVRKVSAFKNALSESGRACGIVRGGWRRGSGPRSAGFDGLESATRETFPRFPSLGAGRLAAVRQFNIAVLVSDYILQMPLLLDTGITE
jgi:hypothetical protein